MNTENITTEAICNRIDIVMTALTEAVDNGDEDQEKINNHYLPRLGRIYQRVQLDGEVNELDLKFINVLMFMYT